jgi:hypothetical protein
MGFFDNLKDALVTGGDRQSFHARRDARLGQELIARLRLGQVAINGAQQIAPPHWTKYTSGTGRDGTPQTNYFEGVIGERDQRRKVHVVVDANGVLRYIRDIDGTVLFDRSRGDTPPPRLELSNSSWAETLKRP